MSDEQGDFNIGVSQEFPSSGRWIVHGCNPNRHPKIAYCETQAEAERAAVAVRQVIREAVANLRLLVDGYREIADQESHARAQFSSALRRAVVAMDPKNRVRQAIIKEFPMMFGAEGL